MKKIAITTLILILGFVATVEGGEIYGRLTMGGQPLGGTKVEIVCGDFATSTLTDERGYYRLLVKAIGKCTLHVAYKDSAPSLTVFSGDRPVRYNLVLEKKNGGYELRRV